MQKSFFEYLYRCETQFTTSHALPQSIRYIYVMLDLQPHYNEVAE